MTADRKSAVVLLLLLFVLACRGFGITLRSWHRFECLHDVPRQPLAAKRELF